MNLFFYMTLGLNDFDAGKYITWALERMGLENLDFFGPNKYGTRFARCHFRPPPPFQWPL
jgi:hypothetical protein